MKAPQAVLFDWDGTLADTLQGVQIAHNYVRETYGLKPWDEKEFAEHTKHSSRELYPRIYGDKSPEAMQRLLDYLETHHLKYLSALPEAQSLLLFLKGKGVPMAVVSNKRHEIVTREVAHLGWNDFFFRVLGAGQAARDKPAGDPVLLALKSAPQAVSAEKTWFVGDTETDLLAAQDAGCPSLFLTHGRDREDLLSKYRPLVVARDCMDLLKTLQNSSIFL